VRAIDHAPQPPPRTRRRLGFHLRGWTVSLALSLAVTGCAGSPASKHALSTGPSGSLDHVGLTVYAAGQRPMAPALVGTTLDGQPYSSARFAGDVVVVNVWASWCGPCREESAALAATSKSMAGAGVHFVGLDEADTRPAALKFAKTAGVNYPLVFDQSSSLLARLKVLPVRGIPSTMVLDRSGHVAGRVIGVVSVAELTSLVQRAEAS
jgi:thiol-disulfide isomerase/thioredoxin